jgi:hypothetical protein
MTTHTQAGEYDKRVSRVVTYSTTHRSAADHGVAHRSISHTPTLSRSELPATYFQLACINCEQGDKSAAARYIERGIADLAKRSRETTAHNTAALKKSVAELQHQARRLRAGHSVSAARIKAAASKANQAVVSKTRRVAGAVKNRSAKVFNASAAFGHSAVKDTKRDVKYTGTRAKLLGGRVGKLVSSTASAVAGR